MAALLQIWIAITGCIAIWLVTSSSIRHRYYGCWIGLLGQPAWLITTVTHFQWGILVLTIVYTASYMRGLLRARLAINHLLRQLDGFDSASRRSILTANEAASKYGVE